MDIRLREHEGKAEPRCPYCHDALAGAKTWECPRCRTPHHVGCARENKRCAELGCQGEFHELPGAHAPPLVGERERTLGTVGTVILGAATGFAILGLIFLDAWAVTHWGELDAGLLVALIALTAAPFVVLALWLNDKLERRRRG
jgi:hypothetical protein